MSKLHQPHGRADADTDKGELRKPGDYSNQPGQGGAYTVHESAVREGAHPDHEADACPDEEESPGLVGESSREYGHASGDRNTMKDEPDWHGFQGGRQRDATPGAPRDGQARRGGSPDDGSDS